MPQGGWEKLGAGEIRVVAWSGFIRRRESLAYCKTFVFRPYLAMANLDSGFVKIRPMKLVLRNWMKRFQSERRTEPEESMIN